MGTRAVKPTVYPEQVGRMLRACAAYREGDLAFEVFKAEVWRCACAIEACDELDFREFLQCAEARLDMAQFGPESELGGQAAEVAREVAAECARRLP
ncbi:MAG: hypothetical protein R3F62_04395 [Planctomycetota bacterium]